MPRVVFAAHLRRHVEVAPQQVPGATVRAALDAAFLAAPRLRGYVLDEQGALRQHVIVFINARRLLDRAGLSDALAEQDEVHVFQALSGG
jgi:molybdopterin converting factor small subunit